MKSWWRRWRQVRPRAITDTVAVSVDTPFAFSPLANDRGRNKRITHVNDLRITDGGSVVAVDNGTVSLSGEQLTFTPTTSYTGPVQFTYTFTSGAHQKLGEVVGEVS